MNPVFQALLLVGDLIFLVMIFVLVKNGKLSVRFSLPWLGLGAGLLVLAVWPEIAKILRSILHVEVVSNMVFILLFCFVLLVLLILCAVVSEHNERLKRLTQENAMLEQRVRLLEQRLEETNKP